jgi:hypothetical protein
MRICGMIEFAYLFNNTLPHVTMIIYVFQLFYVQSLVKRERQFEESFR